MIVRSLSNRIAIYPSIGVYYVVPDKSLSNWVLLSLSQRDPLTGESQNTEADLCHYQLLGNVVSYFLTNFNIDIGGIGKRCLPRGRVELQNNNQWKVFHGNDTPAVVRNQIVDEFGLHSIMAKWEYSEFQSMLDRDKEILISRMPEVKELFEQLES